MTLMKSFGLNRCKLALTGLILAGLLGGSLIPMGWAQQGQGVIGSQHAVLIVAQAVTRFDMLLLANSGAVSGMILNEAFTIVPEGGSSQTLTREEVDTLDLAARGRLLDRIILKSGEILQGHLQLEAFRVKLATDGEVSLPRDQVEGAILQIPMEDQCEEEICPQPDPQMMVELLRRLIDNPLMAELVNSLTKYDWIWLANGGLLSGNISDEKMSFLTEEGGRQTFQKDELSVIVFSRRAEVTLVVLKQAGEFVMVGALEDKIHLNPSYQLGSTIALSQDQIRAVLFRVPSLGGGGG